MTDSSTAAYGAGGLAVEFVTLNDYLGAGGGRDEMLQRLVRLAVRAVPACRWAAVTAWPVNKTPHSLSVSDEVAAQLDGLQYDLRDGPCLSAAVDSEIVHITDIALDERWPTFSAAAQEQTPLRGVLSYHLADMPHRTALNLYTDVVDAYDADAISIAALFAAHARVLLSHAASTDKVEHLEHALTTSRQIGAAIGILMSAHKITADEAFGMLRTSSQALHRKLHDIALDVTETGVLPDRP